MFLGSEQENGIKQKRAASQRPFFMNFNAYEKVFYPCLMQITERINITLPANCYSILGAVS